MSGKIKEEIIKQLTAKVIRVMRYPTWLANVVPVPKKDEFDIIYVTRTAMKAQALADHLAENPVDDEYKPLKTYFPDEEEMHVDEVDHDENPGWKLFFDGVANMKGVGIGVVLISETGQHYPVIAQLRFYCTNNMAEYEVCILGLRLAVDMGIQEILVLGDSDLLVHQIQGEWETRDLKLIPYRQCLHDLCQRFRSVEFRHIPRVHNKISNALATLASMLHHPDKAYVDPVHIQVRDQHAYCNVVEEKIDGEPWFHDIKEYIRSGVYPVYATGDQKRTIRRLASRFFLSGGILYKRTPDLGLLRCIDDKEASTIMAKMHSRSFDERGMPTVQDHASELHSVPPQGKWAAEAANKNIKKILRKMVQGSRQWHEKLPFALLGYRTTICTSVGATPYLLVYRTEAIIPVEVEIPSLWIVAKVESDDDE
ncbi:uncharacterized protein [Nicotiana sylvestris]|uniref:uncharacterized protein n=1 Tax=Nicotiana sylvestris TaxID=4096 RepID=UPI00388CC6BB